MAITQMHDKILITLKEEGIVGHGLTDSIFELGEQNWYGDIQAIDYLEQLINRYIKPEEKNKFLKDYESIKKDSQKNKNINLILLNFKIAKLYYKIIFNFKTYKAIDFHGTIFSIKKDLNFPYVENTKYDLITNFGTTEHIFNQYEVYKTIHNLVKPNGFMMHSLPCQGAYNHGFYIYNPTFFFDLGKANNYIIGGLWITTIIDSTPKMFNIHNMDGYNHFLKNNIHPKECYIFVLYKSPADRIKEFVIPQQGVYFDKDFSKESRQLWDKYKAPIK